MVIKIVYEDSPGALHIATLYSLRNNLLQRIFTNTICNVNVYRLWMYIVAIDFDWGSTRVSSSQFVFLLHRGLQSTGCEIALRSFKSLFSQSSIAHRDPLRTVSEIVLAMSS